MPKKPRTGPKHNSLFSVFERLGELESRVSVLEHEGSVGTKFGAGNPKIPPSEKRCAFTLKRYGRQCRRLRLNNQKRKSEYCSIHWLISQPPESLDERQKRNLFLLQNPPSSHPDIWLVPAVTPSEGQFSSVFLNTQEQDHEEFHYPPSEEETEAALNQGTQEL